MRRAELSSPVRRVTAPVDAGLTRALLAVIRDKKPQSIAELPASLPVGHSRILRRHTPQSLKPVGFVHDEECQAIAYRAYRSCPSVSHQGRSVLEQSIDSSGLRYHLRFLASVPVTRVGFAKYVEFDTPEGALEEPAVSNRRALLAALPRAVRFDLTRAVRRPQRPGPCAHVITRCRTVKLIDFRRASSMAVQR